MNKNPLSKIGLLIIVLGLAATVALAGLQKPEKRQREHVDNRGSSAMQVASIATVQDYAAANQNAKGKILKALGGNVKPLVYDTDVLTNHAVGTIQFQNGWHQADTNGDGVGVILTNGDSRGWMNTGSFPDDYLFDGEAFENEESWWTGGEKARLALSIKVEVSSTMTCEMEAISVEPSAIDWEDDPTDHDNWWFLNDQWEILSRAKFSLPNWSYNDWYLDSYWDEWTSPSNVLYTPDGHDYGVYWLQVENQWSAIAGTNDWYTAGLTTVEIPLAAGKNTVEFMVADEYDASYQNSAMIIYGCLVTPVTVQPNAPTDSALVPLPEANSSLGTR